MSFAIDCRNPSALIPSAGKVRPANPNTFNEGTSSIQIASDTTGVARSSIIARRIARTSVAVGSRSQAKKSKSSGRRRPNCELTSSRNCSVSRMLASWASSARLPEKRSRLSETAPSTEMSDRVKATKPSSEGRDSASCPQRDQNEDEPDRS